MHTEDTWDYSKKEDMTHGIAITSDGAVFATVDGADAEAEANARRICQCVNCHDALLAACKEIISNEPFGITPYFDKTLRKVEQAIAQAESEE